MKKHYWIFLFILPILGLFALSTSYLEKQLEQWLEERVAHELLQEAELLSNMLRVSQISPDIAVMQSFLQDLDNDSEYRITVIEESGKVLADTRLTLPEVETIENHSKRPEILAARNNQPGISKRLSDTINTELMYLAIPYDGEWKGHIRISIALTRVQQYIHELHVKFAYFGLIGFGLLLALSLIGFKFINSIYRQHRRELEQKILDRTEDILKLQKLGQIFSACQIQAELFDVVSLAADSLFPGTSGALSITHPSMDQNEIVTTWGDEWSGAKLFAPNDCWAFRRGGSFISDKSTINLRCHHIDSSATSICNPLVSQGITVGSLHLLLKENNADEVIQMFTTFSDNVGLALANLNLRESLKRQALRDPLTNLYNRRYLDEILQKEIHRAERHQTNVGVMMIDVDHFKKFNDTFGHEAGDLVLQKLAGVMLANIRKEEIPCRYGGEEFLIILSDTSMDILTKRANVLLHKARELELAYNNRPLDQITLSIGLALFPIDGETPDELIKVADEALYRAKKNGRNQICSANHHLEPAQTS